MAPGPARARPPAAGLLVVALALAACSGGDGSTQARRRPSTTGTGNPTTSTAAPATSTTAPDPCAAAPVTVDGPAGESVFVADAQFATALAWAPDGRLFFAERGGAIRIASGDEVTEFVTVPTVTSERTGGYSERGLLGLALSPDFANDHHVFAFYSRNDHATQVVVRFTECAGVARDEATIVTLPSGPDCCHKGGRIAFGPDGKLYVTVGDQHAVRGDSVGSASSVPQDPGDVRGKILRYEPDGSVPADNPFGADNPVWATGFRNPFGLAFGGGSAFVTSNGPTGDLGTPRTGYDLAFRVEPGGRHQWPACYGYSHLVPGAASCLGHPDPEWSSEDATVVPTGATWVDERGPAPYAGHFVFCSTSGMRVFTPGASRATVSDGPSNCILDVKQGPDGALYFAGQDAIHRLAG